MRHTNSRRHVWLAYGMGVLTMVGLLIVGQVLLNPRPAEAQVRQRSGDTNRATRGTDRMPGDGFDAAAQRNEMISQLKQINQKLDALIAATEKAGDGAADKDKPAAPREGRTIKRRPQGDTGTPDRP